MFVRLSKASYLIVSDSSAGSRETSVTSVSIVTKLARGSSFAWTVGASKAHLPQSCSRLPTHSIIAPLPVTHSKTTLCSTPQLLPCSYFFLLTLARRFAKQNDILVQFAPPSTSPRPLRITSVKMYCRVLYAPIVAWAYINRIYLFLGCMMSSMGLRNAAICLRLTCVYISVVLTLLCPKSS